MIVPDLNVRIKTNLGGRLVDILFGLASRQLELLLSFSIQPLAASPLSHFESGYPRHPKIMPSWSYTPWMYVSPEGCPPREFCPWELSWTGQRVFTMDFNSFKKTIQGATVRHLLKMFWLSLSLIEPHAQQLSAVLRDHIDLHVISSGLELGATKAYNQRVNITSVKISFYEKALLTFRSLKMQSALTIPRNTSDEFQRNIPDTLQFKWRYRNQVVSNAR